MTTDFSHDLPQGHPPRKPRYQPLLLAVLAFAGGIAVDFGLDFQTQVYVALFVGSLLLWLAMACVAKFQSAGASRQTFCTSCLLVVALIALGAGWQHARWNWFGPDEIGRFAAPHSQPCCVRATLLREPRITVFADHDPDLDPMWSAERTKLIVQVAGVRDRQDWLPASGTMDVIVHAAADHVRAGDELQLVGKLVEARPPTNPGQFDFQNYSRKRGMFAVLHVYYPEAISVHGRPAGWSGAKLLSSLRKRLNAIAWEYIDADEAGFASAILLGNREQISRERRNSFLETGTAHLLAISGLHVGILAGSIFLFFRIGMLSRRKCLLATIVFVLFYMWLVEFRPPVTRAAILVTLFCVGRLCGQKGYPFNLLAASALIVLLINPADLFAVGAQLSFLAVATLSFGRQWIWWAPTMDPLQQLIVQTRPFWLRSIYNVGTSLRTAFLGSGMIWLIGSPLVAYHFHLVAPIGLLLNPLLLLPIALGLYGGLATLVLGWVSGPLARLAGLFCQQSLAAIEWAIQTGQSVPLSHFWTAGPDPIALWLFYLGLLLVVVFPVTRLPGRWAICLGMLWLVFAWLVPEQRAGDRTGESVSGETLACTFVDVGHGTSALLQLPSGQNVLYDCGSFGSRRHGLQSVSSVLWSERVAHLDAVVVSHADVDHFNALSELCERFSIGVVYVSPQMLASDAPAVAKLFATLEEQGIPLETVTAGDGWLGATGNDSIPAIEVLAPLGRLPGTSDNSDSIVLLVRHAGRSILLPGDLEAEGLARLLGCEPLRCDVLMAAHHGSRHSDPLRFASWAQPTMVVVSGGRSRVDDDVVKEFDGPGRKVLRTDRDGAVRLTLSMDAIEARIFPAGYWRSLKWIDQP